MITRVRNKKPTAGPTFDQLIAEIQNLELELKHTQNARLNAERELKLLSKKEEQLKTQTEALRTLNLGIFSMLEPIEIYSLVSEFLVRQLGWTGACFIDLHDKKNPVQAGYGFSQKGIKQINQDLPNNFAFKEAYSHRQAISTFHSHDRYALTLRTLFQTDEVAAMPVIFGEQLYAYLAATIQEEKGQRTANSLDLLADVCSQVAHAIFNSRSFQDLEDQNRRLKELDELKNSFISITSHQLRTPLSIIKWILSVLQTDKDIKKLSEQLHLIDQAYASNERLIHVVNDLLNVSRIQEGRLPHNPQISDLKSLMEDVLSNLKPTCANRELSMDINYEEGLPALELDNLLFKEAVQNVIDNAIDYNKPGGWLSIKAFQQGQETVIIEVRNSGGGIAPEDMPRIFDQFYRSATAIKIKPNGNGLGLYLSKVIIEQHGGKITCVSEPEKETVFTISLPIPK